MHGTEGRTGLDGDADHIRIGQARYVVDNFSPGCKCLAGHCRLGRIDRERNAGLCGEFLDDRQNTAEFFVHGDGFGVGAGAFAADIEEVGALSDEFQAMGDGGLGVEVASTIGKAVGSDIDDAHQQRPGWEGEHSITQSPTIGS